MLSTGASSPVPPAGVRNERYEVKQDRPRLSLAQGNGCGAKWAGWRLGPDLPSATGMSWVPDLFHDLCQLHAKCPFPPHHQPRSLKERDREEGGRGGQREGRAEVLEETERGPPWCGKIHVLRGS